MALDTMTGGWRIIKTMGMKISKPHPCQGFAAEMAAAGTINLASQFGIPLSTTHTISSAIMGVGAVQGISAGGCRSDGYGMDLDVPAVCGGQLAGCQDGS